MAWKIYIKLDIIWSLVALSIRSGTFCGSFSINFRLLGDVPGGSSYDQKRFWCQVKIGVLDLFALHPLHEKRWLTTY